MGSFLNPRPIARPLRVDLAEAWNHVMNRGNRGEALLLSDADRRRFLGAVAELPERYGLEVHALVLMDNHYHLLARTSEPNLSQAIRWLNVSYAVKFNRAHALELEASKRSQRPKWQGATCSVLSHYSLANARWIRILSS